MEAAAEANIHIPNLCNNEELNPYGACRLCMVEITDKKRTRLVASCIYQVSEGLVVNTESERALNVRKLVIDLLLARNPDHPVLCEIADKLGVSGTSFAVEKNECILCGMCVRTCAEVVGVSAIGFKGRGQSRDVATPFDEAPADCIACGSCAYVCPVGVIPMEEKEGVRRIWNTDFVMKKCDTCGRDFAPEKQLAHFRKTYNLPEDQFDKCLNCR